ncbi:hypothetical protein Tco_0809439 [Tanacetum coccineum]
MLDEYFNPPPSVASPVPAVVAPKPDDPTCTPSSNTFDQDAPSPSTSQTPQESQSPVIPSSVAEHMGARSSSRLCHDNHFKVVKLEELGDVLKSKATLVARGNHQEEGIDFQESFSPVA